MTNKDDSTNESQATENRYISGDPKIQLSSDRSIPALTLTYTATGWTASGGQYDKDTDTYSVYAEPSLEQGMYYAPVYYYDKTLVSGKSHYCMVYWERTQGGFPSRYFQSVAEISSSTRQYQSNIYGAYGDEFHLNLWLESVRFFKIETQDNANQYAYGPYWLPDRYTSLVTSSAPPSDAQEDYIEFGLVSIGNACLLFSRELSGVIYSTKTKNDGQPLYVGYPTQAELDDTGNYPCQTWNFSQKIDSTLTATSNVGMVWNIKGSGKAEGTVIQIYGRGSGKNMKWTFEKVS